MSFDLVPAELLAAALSAVLMSVAVAFPLAAGIIAGPRRSWSGAGLAMGTGLLAGVVLTAAAAIAGLETLQTLATIGLVLGLACAIGAAVLVILVEDGNTLATTVGVIACVLIGIGQPGRDPPRHAGAQLLDPRGDRLGGDRSRRPGGDHRLPGGRRRPGPRTAARGGSGRHPRRSAHRDRDARRCRSRPCSAH